MNSIERFTLIYGYYLAYDKAENELGLLKIFSGESVFSELFYELFDQANKMMLTDKGMEILFEEILFRDLSVEEAIEMLEGNFL